MNVYETQAAAPRTEAEYIAADNAHEASARRKERAQRFDECGDSPEITTGKTPIISPPTCRQVLPTGRMCRKPASTADPARCAEHATPRAPAARQAKHEATQATTRRRAVVATARQQSQAETARPAPAPAKETAYDQLRRLHPQWFAPDAGRQDRTA